MKSTIPVVWCVITLSVAHTSTDCNWRTRNGPYICLDADNLASEEQVSQSTQCNNPAQVEGHSMFVRITDNNNHCEPIAQFNDTIQPGWNTTDKSFLFGYRTANCSATLILSCGIQSEYLALMSVVDPSNDDNDIDEENRDDLYNQYGFVCINSGHLPSLYTSALAIIVELIKNHFIILNEYYVDNFNPICNNRCSKAFLILLKISLVIQIIFTFARDLYFFNRKLRSVNNAKDNTHWINFVCYVEKFTLSGNFITISTLVFWYSMKLVIKDTSVNTWSIFEMVILCLMLYTVEMSMIPFIFAHVLPVYTVFFWVLIVLYMNIHELLFYILYQIQLCLEPIRDTPLTNGRVCAILLEVTDRSRRFIGMVKRETIGQMILGFMLIFSWFVSIVKML